MPDVSPVDSVLGPRSRRSPARARPAVEAVTVVSGVGRAVVASILSLALAVGLAGCGGDSTTGPDDGGSASVSVTPATSTLVSLGATVNLSASGTSSSGQQVGDGDVNWSSTDPAVATVNGSGLVEAQANGTTRIVAALADGAAADTAEVTVDQEVAETRLEPSSVELPALGDTAHFTATAVDANGFDVEGVAIAWGSSDSSVVTVDEGGVATAVDTGEADVVATPSEGPEGRAEVEVAQPDPVVDAVSPDTLEEGNQATVTGQNFGSNPDDNLVVVDGVPALVTSASATQLQIIIPQYECRPPRGAGLQVVVDDDSSAVVSVAIRPDEQPVTLEVGERLLIEKPADDFCVQLEESGETQEYLVGVQAVTDAVGPTTVTLALSAGATAGSPSVAPSAAPGSGQAPSGQGSSEAGGQAAGEGYVPPTPRAGPAGPEPWMVDWLDGGSAWSPREAQLRQWEREHLGPRIGASIPRRRGAGGPARAQAAAVPPLAAQIGSNPTEGDTVEIRVPDLDAQDPCSGFTTIDALIQEVGTHGVWLEDVDNPSGGFGDSDWQELSDKFDAHTYPTTTDYFGQPSDIDENDRAAIVVTKTLNEAGGILGFVFAGDLFPRSGSGTTCASSDEGELTYVLAPDPEAAHGDTVTTEQLRHLYPSLIAHEFTHIIQFGRRFECSACEFPVPWITEGQATLAEEVVGHDVTGRQPRQNYGFQVAFNPNDSDFTDWYVDRFVDLAFYYGFNGRDQSGNLNPQIESAPEECSWLMSRPQSWGGGPCLGNRAVYGVPSHFLRWINDHIGTGYPGGEEALQRDITGNVQLGFDNIEEVTGESMKSLLGDWGPTLWTDDRVPGVPARLTDPSWDLVDIFQNLVSTARLQPKSRGFTDFSDTFGVNAASAAYYLVGGATRPPVAIRARRPDGAPLPSYMQMWVVRTR